MKILIYCAHPAQFLFYKFVIKKLKEKGHQVKLLIKSKDVLELLIKAEGFDYENILIEGRKDSKIGIIIGLLKRLFRINKIVRKFKPDILLGTDASIAQLAWFYRKPGIITLEDDAEIIPNLAKLAFPFAKHIITPLECSVGKWGSKKIGYAGYMKLAYLHPSYFKPDKSKLSDVKQPFYLIRLSHLKAHHDFGIQGISLSILDTIIDKLEKKGSVLISSERPLPEKYTKYLIKIEPQNIHHYLNFADLLICDSQSMAMEAAMLGTASIRFSDFAGKISVLEELEHNYNLTYGIPTNKPEQLFKKLDELLLMNKLQSVFKDRRDKMLQDKIDVTAFMVWFIENYPQSAKIMKDNPEYQYRFK